MNVSKFAHNYEGAVLTRLLDVSPASLRVHWQRDVQAIERGDQVVGAPYLLEALQNFRLSIYGEYDGSRLITQH